MKSLQWPPLVSGGKSPHLISTDSFGGGGAAWVISEFQLMTVLYKMQTKSSLQGLERRTAPPPPHGSAVTPIEALLVPSSVDTFYITLCVCDGFRKNKPGNRPGPQKCCTH